MSSYVESPFSIEERRLRGIVTQCSNQLNIAVANVEKQLEHMDELQRQQKQEDKNYVTEQEASLQRMLHKMLQEKQQKKWKREQLEQSLRIIEIQTKAFHQINGGMEKSLENYERLQKLYEENMVSAEMLAEQLVEHSEKCIQLMHQIVMEKSQERVLFTQTQHQMFTKKEKGHSLQLEESLQETHLEESPLSLFIHRMEYALSLEYAKQFPSLTQMSQAFQKQPEYAKALFAVENIDSLERLIQQMEMIVKKEKQKSGKWEKLRRYYLAICQMLQVEPDTELVENEEKARMLHLEYKRLCQVYQEQKEEEYIFSAVSEVMARHGIVLQGKQSGSMSFRFGESTNIAVSSDQHKSISMAVSGTYEGRQATLNDKRKSVVEAKKVCSIQKQMEQELAQEYGIFLSDGYREEPTVENIKMVPSSSAETRSRYHATTQLADMIEF